VALNIQSLGACPYICAVIGEDSDGENFLSLLKAQGLSDEGLIKIKTRPTTVKTRIIAHNKQIARVDAETERNLTSYNTIIVLNKIKQIIADHRIDAIIFEDYDKGLITEELIDKTVKLAKEMGIITVVDPKKRNFHAYKGVQLFKPNLKELREGLKIDIDPSNLEQVEQAVEKLKKQLGAKTIMLTLSEHGVYVSSATGNKHILAHKRNIADVSGAGDTVIATAALCLAAGLNEFKTAEIANLAGGLVCEHVGVVPIDKARLLREVEEL
jgi:rfaE bifunctional protein kinase chain/domain